CRIRYAISPMSAAPYPCCRCSGNVYTPPISTKSFNSKSIFATAAITPEPDATPPAPPAPPVPPPLPPPAPPPPTPPPSPPLPPKPPPPRPPTTPEPAAPPAAPRRPASPSTRPPSTPSTRNTGLLPAGTSPRPRHRIHKTPLVLHERIHICIKQNPPLLLIQ